ncbi:MAG: penicillin-binding protein 2 [Patescibacteria group bacterium]|nr:penicillin-binding protein 2 [Patescibacteria group bacterium]
MNSSQHLRARLSFGFIILAALFLAATLYWTQIIEGDSYAAKADKQYVKPVGSLLDRGTIYFESKDGTRPAAATMQSGYLVYMNPSQLGDPTVAYQALSGYLTLDQGQFMAKAAKPNDQYEVMADQVDASTAQSIKSLAVNGIGVMPSSWRSYPGGSLAAHELGLVGEDARSSAVTGRYGLENWYNNVLERPSGGATMNVFAQLFGGLDSVFGDNNAKEGDIVTTIDPTTERYLEKVLNDTEARWHSDEIGGIIIDPQSGEIAAMSSLPTFDPNNTAAVSSINIFSNPLVEHVYEMGSIIKPLTMAMALDTGAEQPDSTYDDTGTMTLNGKTIANYDGRARGVIPMQQILSQSLNIGAATIALKTEHDIGQGTMLKYFSRYGLDQKTGIDLPNEATGLISNLTPGPNRRDISLATAAYGQGIAISPIETVRALSVLANGGYLVTPHLVKEIDYSDGTIQKISPVKIGPILSTTTVDDVRRMLVEVVDGTMAPVHPDIHWQNYSIAAKTGTAQIPDHVNGGYYPDRYLHSFFGFFPAYNPRFLVFLYQIYPKGAEYASETLTDPFSTIARFLINYYNITPDR